MGKRGKEAIWKLWGHSPLTDGLAGLREANAYVKNGRTPGIKGRIRIRAISQIMNTYTHKH